MSREWRLYLKDLIEFYERIRRYTAGLTRETFEADTLRYDATLRNIELDRRGGSGTSLRMSVNSPPMSRGTKLQEREMSLRTPISALTAISSGISSLRKCPCY